MIRTIFLSSSLIVLLTLCGCAQQHPKAAMPIADSPILQRAIALLQIDARDKDPAIRANVMEAIQPLHDPRTADVIEQGLHDSQWVVRFAAAMAAGERKFTQFRPVLEGLVQHDTSGSVRAAAIYALRRMGDTTHMTLLAGMLNAANPSTRADTAMVLGRLGDPSAIGLLHDHHDADPRVRLEMTSALARLGDSDAINGLIADSLSRYAEDHLIALSTCITLKNPEANNVLLAGLRDPLPAAQLIAARGLGKRGSRQGLDLTLAYVHDSRWQIRQLAALALGDILPWGEDHHLDALLRDRDPRVQIAAAAALINQYTRAQSESQSTGESHSK